MRKNIRSNLREKLRHQDAIIMQITESDSTA